MFLASHRPAPCGILQAMAENGYIALFDTEDGFTPQQVRQLNWNLRRLQRAGDTIVREIGSGGGGGSVVSISHLR